MGITKTQKKLAAGAAAGIAALALIGGGTFALWSDYDVIEDNSVRAGHLQLNIADGPTQSIGHPVAPGENYSYDYFLTSADLAGVPDADLYLSVTNLRDLENGCNGPEVEYDESCGAAGDTGEFSEQSVMRIRWSAPVLNGDPSQCRSGGLATTNGHQTLATAPSLADRVETTVTEPIHLGNLTRNQGVCVRVDVGLPADANNASQGDSSVFDLQFDLRQETPALEPNYTPAPTAVPVAYTP